MRNRPEDESGELGEAIRYGTIAEVDLAAGRCVVDTGDVRSGPIRWVEGRAGATRSWSPPSVGEQVILLCPEGELSAGIAFRGVSSNAFALPGNSLRELVQFEDGAVIAYDPEAHALEAVLPAGGTATIEAPGGILLKGDVEIDGDVQVRGRIDADDKIVGDGISLSEHKHSGVQAGQALSGLPQ